MTITLNGFVTKDEDGEEKFFINQPVLKTGNWQPADVRDIDYMPLPKGSFANLIPGHKEKGLARATVEITI